MLKQDENSAYKNLKNTKQYKSKGIKVCKSLF